jgi:ribosomal protein S27E
MASNKKLPPIDFKEDEKYEAFSESKDVSFNKCTHKNITYNQEHHEIRCTCGSVWTGPQLDVLYKLLKSLD